MRRGTVNSLFVLSSCLGFAQSWCPPGARWTYEAGQFLAGYISMSYTHDTLIDGVTAQVIDRYSAIQYPQPPPAPLYSGLPYIDHDPVAVITRSDSDVVFIRLDSTWDTLYWFGATPGDRWTQPGITDTTCAPFIVNGIGTELIDGVPLRWIEIESWYRVYERIGSTWDMFMYCPNWILDGPMGMRCYEDNDIFHQVSSWDCYAFMGEVEMAYPERATCFPNPGSDHFTLELSPGSHTITVHDALGRSVLTQRTSHGSIRIDTQAFPAGLYHVRIEDADGTVRRAQWVRE